LAVVTARQKQRKTGDAAEEETNIGGAVEGEATVG
jgi:hypothetical protein